MMRSPLASCRMALVRTTAHRQAAQLARQRFVGSSAVRPPLVLCDVARRSWRGDPDFQDHRHHHLGTTPLRHELFNTARRRPGPALPPSHRRALSSSSSSRNNFAKTVAERATALIARIRREAAKVDVRAAVETLSREARAAYEELVGSGGARREVLRQKLHDAPPATEDSSGDEDAGAAFDETQRALMVVEQEEPWEKLRERLRSAPIIQSILRGAKRASETPLGRGAAKAGEKIRDKVDDAREFWETSQNPLVYQASSLVDAVSAETELATAVRQLRRLDPGFSLEEWRLAVSRDLLPGFVDAFCKGDAHALKPWLSEGLFSRLAHEIRLRKQEGLRSDSRVLDVENCEVLATQLDDNDGPPTFVVQFMAQQINCIRNREGDVVEGAPDDIRAYFYVMAFQRYYDPKVHALEWKVIDFQLGGGDRYY